MRQLTLLSLLALTAACSPREPGPNADEFGAVTFWRVASLESTVDSCTDDPEFASATEPPAIEENTFLMYRVSEDGGSAQSMSCTETRASSCTEGDLTFTVAGSTLSTTIGPDLVTTVGGCNIDGLQEWSITDNGETGVFAVALSFVFSGDQNDCDAAEDILSNDSTNGFGLADCTVTMSADLEFSTVD
ncbi:MAG: hypothetical protein EP330_30995 [Deltaproteobacteria bacterium]|nr:MAG: hypothetical protein EP330_30995 [Deltaproteobacteria bacterium]